MKLNHTQLIVVAHAPLASAYLALIEHVLGQVPAGVMAVDVAAYEPLAQIDAKIVQAIGAGTQDTLLLTDLPGATPHNRAAAVAEQLNMGADTVMSGISAPFVLRAVNYHHLGKAVLVDKLRA